MLPLQGIVPGLRFRGAANTAALADLQQGPTCGFEAVENIIQLFANYGNDLTEKDLIPRARQYNALRAAPGGVSLSPAAYVRILVDYGIKASWFPFDVVNIVLPALLADHAILAVGDAHFLGYSPPAPQGSWHAFIITNFYTDYDEKYAFGLIGIDSNYAGSERAWPFSAISAAVKNIPLPLLVTSSPIKWGNRVRNYKLMQDGTIAPHRPT